MADTPLNNTSAGFLSVQPRHPWFNFRDKVGNKKHLRGINMITVIWDTWLKPGTEEEGLRLTRQVWSDMRKFDGYVSHEIYVDQDAPAHITALATWQSRADADGVREKYK